MKRRIVKFAQIVGVQLFAGITLVALWFAWTNWSGAREWKKTREMLVAGGIELDAQKHVPAMPPEDHNFARTPLIAAVTDFENGPRGYVYDNPPLAEHFQEMRLPRPTTFHPVPSWKTGRTAQLSELREILAAETGSEIDILEWLDQFSRELAEIDAAARLPENQIPVRLGETFVDLVSEGLPYLTDLREFQELEIIRACAALRAGDNRQARDALLVSLQLQRTALSHPNMGSYLTGLKMLEWAVSVIWEGLETNRWTEDDLEWIRDQLAASPVLPHLEEVLVFEMIAFQIGAANFMKSIRPEDARHILETRALMEGEPPGHYNPLERLALIGPNGTWDHKIASGTRAMFEEIIRPIRERRLPKSEVFESRLEIKDVHNLYYLLDFPAEGRSGFIFYSFETAIAVELARIACAAELYRIQHGDYPTTTDVLVPDFLDVIPQDLFDPGKPLKYEKGAQGDLYRIYSIGQNGTDDGGRVEFRHTRHGVSRDSENGDWAWGYRFPEQGK